MPPVHNAETLERDQATLDLISVETAGTILAILSSLLVLVSGWESRELIECRYRGDDQRPRGAPRPARTALQSMVVAIVSVGVLTWAAAVRVDQRQRDDVAGVEASGAAWPSTAILIGFLIGIVATGIKALAVGKRYQEEAEVVIF